MKKIIIELSDEQHAKMMEHLTKENKLNGDNDTLSGYGLSLNCPFPGISWLEVEMNGILDLGDVNFKII